MRTAEDLLLAKTSDMISVTAETTIAEALKVMILHKIGAILVKKDQALVGIWTERDLMRDTLTAGFDPGQAVIGASMSTELIAAAWDDTVYSLMDKFLGLRVRHLLVEKDGDYIGLLSIGDVLKAGLQEKSTELEALHSLVSWDYYEEWKWSGAEVQS
jgi:CBS domain-containing protein